MVFAGVIVLFLEHLLARRFPQVCGIFGGAFILKIETLKCCISHLLLCNKLHLFVAASKSKPLSSHNFDVSSIYEWRQGVALAQSVSWGASQEVGQGCRMWSNQLPRGLTYMAIGGRPQLLTTWPSPSGLRLVTTRDLTFSRASGLRQNKEEVAKPFMSSLGHHAPLFLPHSIC